MSSTEKSDIQPNDPTTQLRDMKLATRNEPVGYNSIGSLEAERARKRAEKVVKRKLTLQSVIVLAIVWIAFTMLTLPWRSYFEETVKTDTTWTGQDIIAPFEIASTDDSIVSEGRIYVENNNDKVFVISKQAYNQSQNTLASLDQAYIDIVGQVGDAELRRTIQNKAKIVLLPETVNLLRSETSRTLVLNTVRKMIDTMSARGMMLDVSELRMAEQKGRARLENTDGDLITTMSAASVLGFPTETFGYMTNSWLRENCPLPELFNACADLGRQALRPNLQFDPRRTEGRKSDLLKTLTNQFFYPMGTVIIRRGDYITPQQETLARIISSKKLDKILIKTVGCTIVVLLLLSFIFIYARVQNFRWLVFSWRNILLLVVPVYLAVIIPDILILMGIPRSVGEIYCYPAGMIGMVFALLFQKRLSIMMMLWSCMMYGVVRDLDFAFFPVAIAGTITPLACMRNIVERKQLFWAGAAVSAVSIGAAFVISWTDGNLMPDHMTLTVSALNGILCYLLTCGLLPVLEMTLRVATPWRLWEITTLDHPLLREMEAKIPGSYQHVQDVAKMAEAAAAAIGADRLLVRAGAYFHDVGKIQRPKYFTENQVTPEEREAHKPLPPAISATIIKQHVFDGIKLAEKHRLPQEVIDFIPQHHGTGLISYFYQQAKKDSMPNDLVPELEFRYPGPRPQSLETAIVMIADSTEAASTAKLRKREHIYEFEIARLVDELIAGKINDRQLDACPINREQLGLIRNSLIRSLQAKYHGRVDYPTADKALPNVKDVSTIIPKKNE